MRTIKGHLHRHQWTPITMIKLQQMKLLLTDVMILIMKLNINMNMNPTLKTLPQGKDGNTQCQNERK